MTYKEHFLKIAGLRRDFKKAKNDVLINHYPEYEHEYKKQVPKNWDRNTALITLGGMGVLGGLGAAVSSKGNRTHGALAGAAAGALGGMIGKYKANKKMSNRAILNVRAKTNNRDKNVTVNINK